MSFQEITPKPDQIQRDAEGASKPLAFWVKVLLFVMIFGILNWGLNRFFEKTILSELIIYELDEKYQQSKGHNTIIIVGDSHPRDAIDSDFLEGSFNFSSSNESYLLNYYKLRAALEEDSDLIRVAILPYDLHSFDSVRTDILIPSRYYWKNYADYFEVGIKKHQIGLYFRERVLAEFNYMAQYNTTRDILLQKIREAAKGREEQDDEIVINDPVLNAERTAKMQFEGGQVLDNVQIEYFMRMLELCKQNNVAVVLVKYPVMEDYYNEALKYVDADAYYAQLDAMIAENDYHVLQLDYQKAFFGEEFYGYFKNSSHLNPVGAEMFTREIGVVINGMLAQGSHVP